LDYSAKVKGGYIEVNIVEDVQAMRDAYQLHLRKRSEGFQKGLSEEQLNQMGLKNYTWEEWKAYYRKMHGLPEDGIKRIPFEGKRKERNIDYGPRNALSAEELAKNGITMSNDGPVMIPLDKAMAVSNSLLQGAKTITTIRDGLEVMRQGLDSETDNLKKRNNNGPQVVVMQSGGGDANPSADVVASSSSSDSEVG